MTIQEPTEEMIEAGGRKPPITPSGQLPPLHSLAPELHRSIGNTSRGGPNQTRTLWEWLTLDNRRPDYRARQAALALIERLCALAMQSSSLLIREEDQGVGASSGSKASPQAATHLGPSGYDPAREVPKAICGYPLPGWQLGYVAFDVPKDGQPSGWVVKLQREHPNWADNRHEYNVMARSDVGPLEAWDEALRIAVRCDERHAIATEAGTATTENTGVVHDGAGPQDIARKDKS